MLITLSLKSSSSVDSFIKLKTEILLSSINLISHFSFYKVLSNIFPNKTYPFPAAPAHIVLSLDQAIFIRDPIFVLLKF